MKRVLFVCLGNICRSPLAEGIFQNMVEEENLSDQIMCDSAGTSGWHIGESPDPRSEEVANRHGLSLNHKGRKLTNSDLDTFDIIVAMDKSNYAHIRTMQNFKNIDPSKLVMMREFDDMGNGKDVPDPYYDADDGFQKVYEILSRSCKNLLEEIKTNK